MRRWLLGLAIGLAACGSAYVETPSAESQIAIATPPISRCMNLGSALEAYYEGEWGYTIRRIDIIRLKEAGFDTVRLPIRWSAHTAQTAPYKIDPAFLARVDEIVGWTEEMGLNIIVNVHHYAKMIVDFLAKKKNFGIDITISDETEMVLETGGGLQKAAWFFQDEPFLVHRDRA